MKKWLTQAGRFRVEKWPAPHPTSPVDLTAPRKGVLHTTEGGFESALSVFQRHYAPTFMVGRDGKGKVRILQFLPLGDMAAALENHYGGVETNREALAQIEIVGSSCKTTWLPDKEVTEALASLLVELEEQGKIPLRHPVVKRDPKVWTVASGWVGHCDVPENSHWDPGALNWSGLFSICRTVAPSVRRPWPVPIPKWFWAWARWYLGGRQVGKRPKNAPLHIPVWAWKRLKALRGSV